MGFSTCMLMIKVAQGVWFHSQHARTNAFTHKQLGEIVSIERKVHWPLCRSNQNRIEGNKEECTASKLVSFSQNVANMLSRS